ncbi:MAG: WxcM-like domain-containing protein [Pseudomonadota bacterium]|nr:WxcM-like domain-containing protein [Pseudomonadota bacterium]
MSIGPGVIFAEEGTRRTVLRAGVHIGAGAVVGAGIELGWGAHVEPGSVVLASVPPNAIVRGNPAAIIGYTEASQARPPGAPIQTVDAPQGDVRRATPHRIGVGEAALYSMPLITDLRGSLTVGEFTESFPFVPKRYFMVFAVPSEKLRGEHAHRECEEFLVCVQGSCRALLDDGRARREVVLDRPNLGLYMPPMIWGTQYRYTRDAVLLVLASHPYDSADYIRTYGEFREEVGRETR